LDYSFFNSVAVVQRQVFQVGFLRSPCHSGRREAAIRNLEIPGSMLAHRPGMTNAQ
jgi:hypothetical protein